MTDITMSYDNLVERVTEEIHEGLGGGGWGYSCYGGNEEYHKAAELRSAARAAIAVVLDEAAKVIAGMPRTHTTVKTCDVMGMEAELTLTLNNGPADCAAAIRAMKEPQP